MLRVIPECGASESVCVECAVQRAEAWPPIDKWMVAACRRCVSPVLAHALQPQRARLKNECAGRCRTNRHADEAHRDDQRRQQARVAGR
jgi:hypothetical protein